MGSSRRRRPMVTVPYVIYRNTMFLRKIDHGFEFVEDYTGVVRTDRQLPDLDDIKAAIKRAGKPFKGKKDRFVLIDWGYGALEALPGWGVVSGNLYQRDIRKEEVELILSQDNVEAVVIVDEEGNVTYDTKE
jgi:hypothetical protein